MEKEDEGRQNKYERTKDGAYVLRDERGKMLISTTYPAVLFDRDTGLLHKHGDFARLRKIAAEMRSKYARVGARELAVNLTIYASATFDIEELNRCLSIDGYCKSMHERLSKQ